MQPQFQIIQNVVPPGVIDLGLGNPQDSLLPLNLLKRAADSFFARNDASHLQYGAEAGDGYFRRALADLLGRNYGFPVDMEHLFATTGASGGLDLLCSLYTQPGEVIFVEEPSYFLALRIFAEHGLKIVSIQTDEGGLVIEDLERHLKTLRPKLLYCIPSFQNPSGRTLSRERREQMIALSREHGFLIAADEVYQFLNYGSQLPKPFAGYTQVENVVSVNSFSKILAPGLRLGWLQANPQVIQRLSLCGLLDSGGGLNPFTGSVVRGLVEDGGLEENIARLKAVYSERIPVMAASLRRHLPQAEFDVPQGGYFFWVRLPGMDTQVLQQKAKTCKVDIRPGMRFSSQGGLKEYMRLCFAYYGADEIEEGISRLGRCLASMG